MASAYTKGPSDGPVSPAVIFGPFRLDVFERRLYGPDGEIALKPRSKAALVFLVERHGRIVSKDEIVAAVWDHAAVSDEAIAQRIMDIRRALGDDPKAPKFIKTHPCIGYEFIAALTPAEQPKPVEAAPPQPVATARSWRLPASVAAVGAVLAVFVFALRDRAQDETLNFRFERLTSHPALEERAVPVPSSTSVVYVSWETGTPHIYLLDLKNGRSRQLTSGEGETEPDISPDGTLLAYRSLAGAGALEIRPVTGGQIVQVASFGHNPRWSPDGQNLAFEGENVEDNLYIWNGRNKAIQKVELTSPRPLGAKWPVWSEDGREIYYLAGALAHQRKEQGLDANFSGRQIWRTTVVGGVSHLVTPGIGTQEGGFDVDWLNRKLLFVGQDNCLQQCDLPASPKVARNLVRLTATTERHAYPRISSDGVIYLSTVPYGTSFWRVNLAGGKAEPSLTALTDNSLHALGPQLSPDGRMLLFYAYEGERIGIWRLDLATGRRNRLSPSDGYARISPEWKDNRSIRYWRADREGRWRYEATLSADGSRIETEIPAAQEASARRNDTVCTVRTERDSNVTRLVASRHGTLVDISTVPLTVALARCMPKSGLIAYVGSIGARQELWALPVESSRGGSRIHPLGPIPVPDDHEVVGIQELATADELLLTLHPRAGDVWVLTRK